MYQVAIKHLSDILGLASFQKHDMMMVNTTVIKLKLSNVSTKDYANL